MNQHLNDRAQTYLDVPHGELQKRQEDPQAHLVLGNNALQMKAIQAKMGEDFAKKFGDNPKPGQEKK